MSSLSPPRPQRPSAATTPSDPARDPDAITPTTPVSPATDSEYDKLLDVEAVPLPDGQLCLLALPSEVTQGAGPADLPYLKLFCRFITDRKGVVSGILLVTANKIFFDPSKSHPLVQENGCEEYLFSCSVDNLSSVAFFSDISHVHFSKATQRWKGRKKPWKAKNTQDLTEEIQNRTVSAKTDGRDGNEEGGVGGESQDVAEVTKQLERLVLEAAGGAESGKETERQSCLKKEISDPGMTAHGGAGSLMFVRLRQKVTSYTKRKGFSSLDLGKSKPAPMRDAWFALQQEDSDELYAYLSQQRPDLCILEDGEGEVEGERDEEDFVLLDDADEEEEEELSRDGRPGDEWEMVCVEESRSRNTHPVDKEPDCLSDVLKQSVILDAEHVRELSSELPARTVGHAWKLAYSTDKHGASLKTLYRKLSRSDSPVLLLIRDHNQQVFGAFLSEPLRLSEVFYGTGETFLFLLHPRFKCFRWTGENSFFIKGDLDSFAIGGGSGHFGLWLDEALYLGRSSPCYTFNNCSLSESSDFRVLELEAWTFW